MGYLLYDWVFFAVDASTATAAGVAVDWTRLLGGIDPQLVEFESQDAVEVDTVRVADLCSRLDADRMSEAWQYEMTGPTDGRDQLDADTRGLADHVCLFEAPVDGSQVEVIAVLVMEEPDLVPLISGEQAMQSVPSLATFGRPNGIKPVSGIDHAWTYSNLFETGIAILSGRGWIVRIIARWSPDGSGSELGVDYRSRIEAVAAYVNEELR